MWIFIFVMMPLVHGLTITIDPNNEIRALKPLWISTGFSPERAKTHERQSNDLLKKETLLNLQLIGSLPRGAIEQVRVHWLLDLMKGPLEMGHLDEFIHALWKSNLRPGFELMGNPGNKFVSNFSDPQELKLWKASVSHIANHFIAKYGLKEVQQWNFETWNEPDHHHFSPFTSNQTYWNYLRATYEGLENRGLKIGGPGGTCRPPHFFQLCQTFLRFSQSHPMSYVSFHRKGQGEVDSIVQDEYQSTLPLIRSFFPNGSIINDEGDPLKSWWKPQLWRATAAYPALVARHLALTQDILYADLNLVSNDNAFLNSLESTEFREVPFDQRTLLTRLGDCLLIPKPIFHLWTLLALQGNRQIRMMTIDGKKSVFPQGLTIMPSRTNATVSILISSTRSKEKQKIRVRLLPLAGSSTIAVAGLEGRFRELTLSDLRTNPKRAWNEMGRPLKSLNKTQILAIRNASKIEMGDISTIPQVIEVEVDPQSVKMLHFCLTNENAEQPYDVGFHCEEETETLLIFWKYPSKPYCIDSFDLEFSLNGFFWDFKRVEKTMSLNNFHFVSEAKEGWYRIRALSFYGEGGPYSVPIFISCRKD